MAVSRLSSIAALLCISGCSFPDFKAPPFDGASPSPGTNAESCADGARDGDETGIDCGGSCTPCPSCDDGVQNGSESDVDCGGACSQRCNVDQRCERSTDCASLVCASVCQPSSCHDQVRNGRETSTDCGGDCPACNDGDACHIDADCRSSRCQDGLCVSPGCANGLLDGTETDIDCGGKQCSPCVSQSKCLTATDCASRSCGTDQRCAPPTCTDDISNQDESSTDCGGSHCAACAIGESCRQPTDCESSLCHDGTCVPKAPSGQPLSKTKWTFSSSEGSTEMGPTLAIDGDVTTCWTSGTQQNAKMFVQVDLGAPRIFFKALLQTTQTPYAQDFPQGIELYVSNDAEFGDPSATDITGNQWTWIQFDSARVGRYLRFVLTKPASHPWSICEINLYD